MRQQFINYLLLMRLHKPIGIWLLLWPTLWGLWFAAGGLPPMKVLIVFIAGTVLMRSAGCVINDLADRAVDPHVERTRDRPIAAGRVTPHAALRLFITLCGIALAFVFQLDQRTVLLAIPAVLIAASYPFAKRFHSMPQAHLGVAFSWGIPMGFSAVGAATGSPIDWTLCGLLVAANLMWVVAYDTFYAMSDREEDLKIGVKSSAILFGRHDRWITGLLQAGTLAVLLIAGWRLGWYYKGGLLLAAVLALRQQWLIRTREPAACLRAFLDNARFGAVIFLGLLLELR